MVASKDRLSFDLFHLCEYTDFFCNKADKLNFFLKQFSGEEIRVVFSL